MRNRFDQVGKRILRDALRPGGAVANQLEVPSADAQAVDTWFEPELGREAELERSGLLGRMALTPALFEPFHDTPGIDEVRACLRKQLAMDHSRILEAKKQEQDDVPRPTFPRLWILATGRPESVLHGYGFHPIPGWPTGFHEREEADAVGLVVLRELPRQRDSLLLRLLAAGAVLKEAIAELHRLPRDAWEREVAIPALLAARMEIPQTGGDESDKEFLMSTESLYEQWERKTIEQGSTQGAKRALAVFYEARFGTLPAAVAEAIEAMNDTATLERWMVLCATRSQEEIAAALQAELRAMAS